MKVVEIFKGIQGEGRFAGEVVVFLRLAQCSRQCTFCDTSYHKTFTEYSIDEVKKQLESYQISTVVITGGEPLLQWADIAKLRKMTTFHWHLESNGDLIAQKRCSLKSILKLFQYSVFSPKDEKVAEFLYNGLINVSKKKYDIKIVTDLDTTGTDLLKYATSLMPISTNDAGKNVEIRKKVWQYCIDEQKRYSPRLHFEIWGAERGR